jgi:hypothetical protein
MTGDLMKRLRLQYEPTLLPVCVTEDEIINRIEQLEAALRSIAANTCCDKCQEAALVARAALGEKADG